MEWSPVGNVKDIADGKRVCFQANGRSLVLIRRQDRFFCLDSACHHFGGPIWSGDIEELGGRLALVCPWHGYKVDLVTGEGLEKTINEADGSCNMTTKGRVQRTHEVQVNPDTGVISILLAPRGADGTEQQQLASDRFNVQKDQAPQTHQQTNNVQATLPAMGFRSMKSPEEAQQDTEQRKQAMRSRGQAARKAIQDKMRRDAEQRAAASSNNPVQPTMRSFFS